MLEIAQHSQNVQDLASAINESDLEMFLFPDDFMTKLFNIMRWNVDQLFNQKYMFLPASDYYFKYIYTDYNYTKFLKCENWKNSPKGFGQKLPIMVNGSE